MSELKPLRELTAAETGPVVAPDQFGFCTTDELTPLDEVVGQPRALRAADVGLGIRRPGYHMYVSGNSGTGRMAFVRRILNERAKNQPRPSDWVYVGNFDKPEQPTLFSLPAGQGLQLKRDLANMIGQLLEELPKAFQREDFSHEKERLRQTYKQQGQTLIDELNEEARKRDVAVQQISVNQLVFTPLRNGRPISEEDTEKLTADEMKDIEQRQRELVEVAEVLNQKQEELERRLNADVRQVERSFASKLLEPLINEISARYADEKITRWLDRLKTHFIKNLDRFRRRASRIQGHSLDKTLGLSWDADIQERFFEYQVNVLVDNGEVQQAPVVIESAPTYRNLFGTVDRIVDRFGHVVTNFTRIKAGSLHRANGGYLVFHLDDALTEPFVWRQLKRMIKAGQAEFEMYDPFAMFSVSGLEPEPMPLDVKLVAIGHPLLYHLLYLYDEDFRDIFRVKVDFDTELTVPDGAGRMYGQLVRRLSLDEQTLPFDAAGVAELVRASGRIVGDQRKLTSEFRTMMDVIREAAFWAKKEQAAIVSAVHVRKALDEQVFRSDLVAVRIRELIAAVPLLSIAGAELVRLVQATSVQREAVYFDEAAAAREKLKGTKGTGFLRQTDLVGPFVTIAPNATVLKTGLTPSNQTLASAVERHSLTVGDTWKLFAEYARLRRGDPLPESPPFPVSHPYHAPWHERFVVVDLESRLDTLRRERPADVQDARDLLNRYRVLPAHDAAFLMLITADIEGYELRFLKGLDLHALLVNYFKQSADDQVSLETLNRLEERFENLDSYGRRYESPDDHVVWARQEALRCGLTRDLIRADQTVQNLPLDRRIAELGRFVTAAGATEQSVTVVQQTVRTLCAVQLEPELPLDGSLHVLRHDEDADEITLVPRADVIVVWEDRSFQWLAETGFDEYSLPVEKVHRLIVPSRGTRPALLRPTKKSQAVHAYNRNRRDMPWTPQALSVLRNACQPHANELGDVWQRVVELHELAMRHGELFPQPKERKE